ncbi:MAG: fructosamine kinase family protein [Verrucomicrobiota bacterium]
MISESVIEWIEGQEKCRIDRGSIRSASGGCIHDSKLLSTQDGRLLFLKQNRPSFLAMFEAEREGLATLDAAGCLRVPAPLASAVVDESACLLLEGMALGRSSGEAGEKLLGEQLAQLHRKLSPSGKFGGEIDNFIGATPQPNPWTEDWADFFVESRLQHQFELAANRGGIFPDQDDLLDRVHSHLRFLEIDPVLLHGDLWGGNVGFLTGVEPVIFDPASYYGDRETDLAFTKLFGGFSPAFYEAYRIEHPAPESLREEIYNLYHILNHFVLFGGGYAQQAESIIRRILTA